MKTRVGNRILSFILVAVIAFTLLPNVKAHAEEYDNRVPPASNIITGIDPLMESIAAQTVPLGTSMRALALPDTLDAVVDGEPKAVQVSAWESESDYDGDTADTYSFEPVIPSEYTLADSVFLPIIAVTVESALKQTAQAITFAIEKDEYDSTALYLPEGQLVTDADLLAGVTATDENGDSIEATVQSVDGLDRENPAPKDGFSAYTINYEAKHPVTEEVFTVTREVYVTAGVTSMAMAQDELNITGNGNGNYTYSEGILSINSSGTYTIGMTTSGATTDNRIVVNNGATANITLNGVSIDVSGTSEACAFEITGNSTVNLTLQGANTLKSGKYRAGLEVSGNNSLTITAADTSQTLEATGGAYGSGIGGRGGTSPNVHGGNITIKNGKVTALGGNYAAGIGGGRGIGNGSGGSITIEGGYITAQGGSFGAGIGGCTEGAGGTISITGGTINVTGGNGGAAGIGGGNDNNGGTGGSAGDIKISGGTVTATGGQYGGPGIGSGRERTESDGGIVTLSGGMVTAIGSAEADGIGWGRYRRNSNTTNVNVTITGGSVNAATNANHQPTNGSTSVYMNTLTVGSPDVGDDKAISNITVDGSSEYGLHDVVTKNSGKLYVWLRQNSDASANVSVTAGGTDYTRTWARAGTAETQTLLRVGNAATPNITGQPQDATYNQGDTAAPLSVAAGVTDGGTLSYQWYSNTANSTSGGTQVGTNSASYTPGTSTVGTLYYYCVVTNTNNSVSGVKTATATRSVAAITINALVDAETPNITGQPQDAAYNQGDTAAPLSVAAGVTDGGTLSYQWYSNTTNSNTGGTAISGATADSYTPATNVVGVQYYYCVVTNINASANGTPTATTTSTVATVTVNRSGGGSSSDDNDSDSSSTPTVTIVPAKQPDWPTIGSLSGKTAGTNTQRTFTITDNLVKAALEKAQAEAKAQNRTAYGIGAQIVLDTPAAAGVTLTLERAALNRLVSTGAKQFEITGSPIALTLDTKALAELQKQSVGNVTITIKPVTVKGVRNAYDISFRYVKSGKTVRITSLGAGTATLAIPYTPGKNEAAGGLYAVYVDDKGKVNRIADSLYDANSGGVMFSTNHFSVYGVGYAAPSAKFTDIGSHWAKESIDYVVGRGLLSGTTETTFAPDTAMTRAMLVTALGRLAGVDTKAYTGSSFTDVKVDSTFRPYIEWAYKKGIVQGTGNNQFAPDRAITREEIAVIFSNYAKATGYILPVTRTATTYADASSIGSTYKTAVTVMQQAGIMMGGTGNKFNPKASATRAEVSSMLHRYIKLTIDPDTAQGWALNDAGQYLYYKNSKPLTGGQTINGVKYFFNTDGTLKTGWFKDDAGNWRFYSENTMLVGFWDLGTNGNNKTYYFNKDGIMVSGKWLEIDGKWYYFNADGSLAKSTKIDDYEVDENGVRKTK